MPKVRFRVQAARRSNRALDTMPTQALFSYGTLQLAAVQTAQFGRLLEGQRDALNGYRIGQVRIQDGDVVMVSGAEYHPAIYPTGNANDVVEGSVFWITPDELAAADEYEVDDYVRASVRLSSGIQAWAYVGAHL
jgi:gamma-glutamylcyclotransferase (GGCT)/AIG2-like uncharacterized protein YtfP